MNIFKSLFFLALTLLSPALATAQDWVSYESQQQINDLVDTGEELYMATDAGLVVMNKSTLEKTIFNKSNSNLSNNHIQSITLAPNGDTYIGTYDVVMGRFDGTDFQDIEIPMSDEYNPSTTHLYDFKIAPNGDLWLGTSVGVFHKQGQTWSHYGEAEFGVNFFETWDIAINDAGEVFVAGLDVHKLENGEWINITENEEVQGYNNADLFLSTSGDLFFIGDLEKIGRYDGQDWQTYDIDFNGSQAVKFTEDTDGNIYFNSNYNGLFKLVDDAFIPEENAQTEAFDNHISYFYIDEENNHWLNKNIHLSVNKNGTIESTLIAPHTLETNGVKNVNKGANGNLYFTTYSEDNISVLDPDGNWSFLPKPEIAMPFEFYNDILVLADDDIRIATNNGLYHYTGSNWTFTALGNCQNFEMDSQGKIYLRSFDRIYIWDNGTMSEYNADNSSLSSLIISGLGIDSDDNLWISSFEWDGPSAIQKVSSDGIWTTYSSNDYPIFNRPNGDIKFDKDGNVWIIHEPNGALKFDGTAWTNPLAENIDDITNTSISSIEVDAEGKIYFGHQFGMVTLEDGVWDNFINEDVPANFSHDSSMEFDNEGTLWWASNRYGVFSFTPEGTTSSDSKFDITTDFSIYPNPASSHTILDFTIEKKATVNASIYNQLGQLQSRINLGQLPAGIFQETINLSHLPKGIYAIQLEINDKYSTKTIIVQ